MSEHRFDPLEALRSPIVPVTPDPDFATSLRDRLARAIHGIPVQEDTMTNLEQKTDQSHTDHVRQGDVGYVSLWVRDLDRAADFFAAVLGWSYAPGADADGRLVENVTPLHGLVALAAVPDGGVWGPQPRPTLFRSHVVYDIDQAVRRVRDAGGQAEEPTQAPYGRTADCLDNQGAPFAIHQPPPGEARGRGPVNGTRQGDISYLTLQVIDQSTARAFYTAVFGWQFSPGHSPQGWEARDVAPMTGLHGGHHQALVLPMYRVDDITAAVQQVRSEGGTATDPKREPYGLMAECTDDQGTRFYLGQH